MEAMQSLFSRMHAASRAEIEPSLAVRRHRLDLLERLLRENETAFAEAISADFGHRSPHETRLLEVFL